jgi:hypothetical protein
MSRPNIHKKKITNLLERLRYEMSLVYEEHHVEFPNKDMHEIEIDINEVVQEIERVEFVKLKG